MCKKEVSCTISRDGKNQVQQGKFCRQMSLLLSIFKRTPYDIILYSLSCNYLNVQLSELQFYIIITPESLSI